MIVPSYAEGNPVPRSRGPWISIRCKRRVAQVPGSVSSTTKDGCPRCLAFGHLGKHSSRQAGLRRVARSLAFGNRGYRYDASADFNSSAGYIYAPCPSLVLSAKRPPTHRFPLAKNELPNQEWTTWMPAPTLRTWVGSLAQNKLPCAHNVFSKDLF
jgi:hypothetical protein